MWWRSEPHDLHRISDRISSLYVERTHVDRNDNAVVLVNKQRTVSVPAAFIAVMLLGPGVRITHQAVTLLGDSGTSICWVGEHGVRMYAAGLGPNRGTRLLTQQAWLVSRTKERLRVARAMYAMRFPDEDVAQLTMQQLRGREGARIKRLYKHHSQRTGVEWVRREYNHGDPFAAGDDVNRLLSAGNSCLYGICHAAINGIGASPGLGFIHTGSALSFVLDIADLYKADYSIPLAFDLAAAGKVDERDMRLSFRDRLTDGQLLKRIVSDVHRLILGENVRDEDTDRLTLWDDKDGAVPGGVDWSDDEAASEDWHHHVISGPEMPDAPTWH